MNCNVCGSTMGQAIFEAGDNLSLTSLCEIHPASTTIWLCPNCMHLRGEELSDTDRYYESDYKISLNDQDEDQIYEKRGDEIVYRTEHQARVLLDKLQLHAAARVLDYGCAKSSTLKHVLRERPDIDLHLFDVSDMYLPHWETLVAKDHQATFDVPDAWYGTFDIVTSFFALEHIPRPQETILEVARLLNPDGVFYGIVPDTISNPADFVVVDHINHFTTPSLHLALRQAGLSNISIDSDSHRGALIFTARKNGLATECHPSETLARDIRNLANYWKKIGGAISRAESPTPEAEAAIYGSGFYGAYVFSRLRNPDAIRCFLDQSPFLQGREMFGIKIIKPEDIPESIRTLYIGLNPRIARKVIATMPWLNKPGRKLHFLDGVDS